MGGQRARTDEAFVRCPQPKQRQRGQREDKQRPSPMCRGKPCGNSCEQANKQQPPGAMLNVELSGPAWGPAELFGVCGHLPRKGRSGHEPIGG